MNLRTRELRTDLPVRDLSVREILEWPFPEDGELVITDDAVAGRR